MKISCFVTVSQPDGKMKYVGKACDGRGMDLVYLKKHLNTPGHQSNALRRPIPEAQRTIEAEVKAQLNDHREDDIMNDLEELFIPRSLLDVHNEEYNPPQVDLNYQTGMGFGGADSFSDESSAGQPVCCGPMD
ncbi:hypothetical protein PGT21_027011 [Puccinia graminis f. sp. tritici]|uniref:Uncharacterized protein n=1 Tax=Puccinia graminis f. sp. tritici TaxID=56615 RepID=A0A5B0NZ91_PUCGR|nr:hypothetical protein PGT21_027011 [Puccinia graminis f. sp. tritici]